MSELPLVSVLIPAYNSSKYLVEAVDSILNQTYKNVEVLILDDASTDETSRIMEHYKNSNVRPFRNDENIGYLRSCNFLFTQVKGSLIAFQDADDWSFPLKIEKQVMEFIKDNSLGLCATRSRTEVTFDRLTIDSVGGVSTHEDISKYISEKFSVPFTCATIMVNKKVLDSIGPYRLFFDRIGAEHVDWALMICEKFKSIVIDEILYHYRFNKNSFTKIVDYSVLKRKSLEYTKFFHVQRLKFGKDSLQGLDEQYLEDFTLSLTKPYHLDNSLIYREVSLDLLNKRMYIDSLRVIYKGILTKPAVGKNWRLLLVVLLRSCSGILRGIRRFK